MPFAGADMALKPQKIAMISGAGRGIGCAIAQVLLRDGWCLSLGIHRACDPSLEADDRVLACSYEARSSESAHSWIEQTLHRFGRIDALVNNAGVLRALAFTGDSGDAALDEMWEVNARGPWQLSRLAFPHLAKTRGRVVNIVSISGKRATVPKEAGYCVSKFAAMGVSEVMRAAGARVGIGVTAICPGWVNSGMVELEDGAQAVQPDDVARAVSYVLALPGRVVVPELVLDDRLEHLPHES